MPLLLHSLSGKIRFLGAAALLFRPQIPRFFFTVLLLLFILLRIIWFQQRLSLFLCRVVAANEECTVNKFQWEMLAEKLKGTIK